MRDAAGMAAGKVQYALSELSGQHGVRPVGDVLLGFASPGEDESVGMFSQRLKVKLDVRILPEFVLEPVQDVRRHQATLVGVRDVLRGRASELPAIRVPSANSLRAGTTPNVRYES
jgi:hypothetical protein